MIRPAFLTGILDSGSSAAALENAGWRPLNLNKWISALSVAACVAEDYSFLSLPDPEAGYRVNTP